MYCNRYAIRRRQWAARDVKTIFLFRGSLKGQNKAFLALSYFSVRKHVPDAGDAGNARDATTQQSSHPTFQDFQTHKIDVTQQMPEMSGMLGMQPTGHKKVPGFVDIS